MIDTPELMNAEDSLTYENASNIKTRAFMFVHYGNPCLIYDNVSNIRHCFTIYHDKDTKPHTLNEKVIPHYHTIVTFQNPKYLSAMRKVAKNLFLAYGQSFFVEPCHSLAKAAEYALHRTTECLEDVNKHQYEFNDAICDNDAYWHKVIDCSDDCYNEEFVKDILTLEPIKMAYKYGKDYIRNHKQYNDFRSFILTIYDGSLPQLMENVNLEGDKLNFKQLLNSYYIFKEN